MFHVDLIFIVNTFLFSIRIGIEFFFCSTENGARSQFYTPSVYPLKNKQIITKDTWDRRRRRLKKLNLSYIMDGSRLNNGSEFWIQIVVLRFSCVVILYTSLFLPPPTARVCATDRFQLSYRNKRISPVLIPLYHVKLQWEVPLIVVANFNYNPSFPWKLLGSTAH